MGSKSKSKNKSTSTNAAQMAALQRANPATTMEQAMGNQQAMQNDQLGQVMGAFNAMKEAGDAQMAQNPMYNLMTKMFGEAPQRSNVMFDASGFGPMSDKDLELASKPPQQQAQMPPVTPFMRGQYIVDQGMANGGQIAPPRISLFDQISGVPYAGIQKDV